MDPLVYLLNGLILKGEPPFDWAIEHAPDGDLDAALARLWAESREDGAMRRLLDILDPPTIVTDKDRARDDFDPGHYERRFFCASGWDCLSEPCGRCADAVRKHAACPSLSAYMKSME